MKYTEYTTTEGQRWDTIAWQCFGNVDLVGLLYDANPGVALTDELPGGLTLRVPLIEPVEEVNAELLPPWKR
jgi:phage tail protein X